MRQMVSEIHSGLLTIDQAMAKYKIRTRRTVTGWLCRMRTEDQKREEAMKRKDKPEPSTNIVEQIAHKADELAGRVKHLEKELEQAELKVLYYTQVIRVAEQELGIAIEKKFDTKQSST